MLDCLNPASFVPIFRFRRSGRQPDRMVPPNTQLRHSSHGLHSRRTIAVSVHAYQFFENTSPNSDLNRRVALPVRAEAQGAFDRCSSETGPLLIKAWTGTYDPERTQPWAAARISCFTGQAGLGRGRLGAAGGPSPRPALRTTSGGGRSGSRLGVASGGARVASAEPEGRGGPGRFHASGSSS